MSPPSSSVREAGCGIAHHAPATLFRAPRHAHLRLQPALYLAMCPCARSWQRPPIVFLSLVVTHGHNDSSSSMHPQCVSLLSQVGGGGKAESPRLQNRADPGPGHTAGAARAGGLPTQVSSLGRTIAFGTSIYGFQKGNWGMAGTAETDVPCRLTIDKKVYGRNEYNDFYHWTARQASASCAADSKVSSELIRLPHPRLNSQQHCASNDRANTTAFPLSVTYRLCGQQSLVFLWNASGGRWHLSDAGTKFCNLMTQVLDAGEAAGRGQ